MIVTRLTEHDDITKSLLRGVPRLGLALDPASARAVPDLMKHALTGLSTTTILDQSNAE